MKYVNYFLLILLFLSTAVPAVVIFDKVSDKNKTVEVPYAAEYNITKTPYTISPIADRKFKVSNPIIKEIIELELPD